MRLDLLERRRERVEPTPQRVEPPGLDPARELAAHIARVHPAGQEQAGFKDRFVADNLDQ